MHWLVISFLICLCLFGTCIFHFLWSKDKDCRPSTGPPEDGLRSRHANPVQKKTTNVPETVENSAPRTDLAQILMVFTVFFILLLCIVQIFSNSLGLPLTTLPLIGITSVLSVGIVGAKFARTWARRFYDLRKYVQCDMFTVWRWFFSQCT